MTIDEFPKTAGQDEFIGHLARDAEFLGGSGDRHVLGGLLSHGIILQTAFPNVNSKNLAV